MADAPLMCSAVRRVGPTFGTPCPNRASTIMDGQALCGTHARLAAEGKLQAKNDAMKRGERRVTAVKDALYDFLCDIKGPPLDKQIELMAQDIVATIENMK